MTLRINKGHLFALGLLTLSILWILSGPSSPEKIDPTSIPVANKGLTSVKVEQLQPSQVERELIIHGKTAANREVTVRAETEGRITALLKKQGARVKKGDVIAKIDIRDWQARLDQAKALVKQRELEYQGSQRLKGKGLVNDAELAAALTQLKAATADALAMNIRVKASKLRAPFDGVLDLTYIDQGDYVKVGDKAFLLLDYSPLIIEGDVSEKDAPFLKHGAQASAQLITGEQLNGKLTYIASKADSATHTFKVEMSVSAPAHKMTAGITTKIRLPLPRVNAIKVTPALLLLDDDGILGMKGVNNENQVTFYPVTIAKAEVDGIWVSGLPFPITLIIAGQGFVKNGETVIAVHQKPPAQELNNGPEALVQTDTASLSSKEN